MNLLKTVLITTTIISSTLGIIACQKNASQSQTLDEPSQPSSSGVNGTQMDQLTYDRLTLYLASQGHDFKIGDNPQAAIDHGEVELVKVEIAGKRYDYLLIYMGDTQTGPLFVEGTTELVGGNSDGDFYLNKSDWVDANIIEDDSDEPGMFPGGAEIVSASIDAANAQIKMTVRHSGGCGDHVYSLEIGSCLETFPVQCREVQLKHMTNDNCEAFLTKDITIPFAEAGLDDGYYQGASLTIHGANNTSVDLVMPR